MAKNTETTAEKNTAEVKAAEPAKKKSPAKKSGGAKPAAKKAPAKQTRTQREGEVFALDIGTRNVVGIIGHNEEDKFCLDYAVSVPHTQRAMIDGQIEDIPEVAKVVKKVKESLEEKSGITLTNVSIAAAGRALRTRRIELSFNVEDKETITEEDVQSYEMEAALKAQDELDTETADSSVSFYCVGHTVVQYLLDDYKIKSLVGHKGKKISVELIAAFLPGTVVESLYAVMDMNGLEVYSLTLEPIAAMNVIIPPEVRLINVALVDIGAGTSDIAISQNGSIVAYAMSTTAGDEITEEIVRKYIVDFETAEKMKLSSDLPKITYSDILGFEHTVESVKFFDELKPVVKVLADNISDSIVEVNGQSPAAVFLVGGGSLIPHLAEFVAEKLEMPENRVAVGKSSAMKNVSFGSTETASPEFVTPIGIGITATHNKGYDFSVITLNDKKIRIFDTRSLKIFDLLGNAGYKPAQIIGHSGRNISYTFNGEKQFVKGELAVPAEIKVNGEAATLETSVKQGDVIEFTPAVSGKNAEAKISDIAGEVSVSYVTVDGEKYPFGVIAWVNNRLVAENYQIQNGDSITVAEIETLEDLTETLPFDATVLDFYKSGKQLSFDYYLKENDDIVTSDKPDEKALRVVSGTAVPSPFSAAADPMPLESGFVEAFARQAQGEPVPAVPPVQPMQEIPQTVQQEEPAQDVPPAPPQPVGEFFIILNGDRIVLPPRPNNLPHEFIELMAIADIDLDNPPPSGDMILKLNGREVSFMDLLNCGDVATIKWSDK
ncbi:MAG: pilus assembly protein PilM [Ruminococcus sp.]|nr:pilus assembly protein PilM [Ruminococcus sp.]MCM1382629.1 pilus assembly protein PilM [Muribaculaceae bacterium]